MNRLDPKEFADELIDRELSGMVNRTMAKVTSIHNAYRLIVGAGIRCDVPPMHDMPRHEMREFIQHRAIGKVQEYLRSHRGSAE